VRITINDDGRGFDVSAAAQAGGLGLTSMTQRAHMLGGQVDLSSDASGSNILITIPISEPHITDAWSVDESVPA
jgi:signal transduction histidine kinase